MSVSCFDSNENSCSRKTIWERNLSVFSFPELLCVWCYCFCTNADNSSSGDATKVSTIFGVGGTIRLLAGENLLSFYDYCFGFFSNGTFNVCWLLLNEGFMVYRNVLARYNISGGSWDLPWFSYLSSYGYEVPTLQWEFEVCYSSRSKFRFLEIWSCLECFSHYLEMMAYAEKGRSVFQDSVTGTWDYPRIVFFLWDRSNCQVSFTIWLSWVNSYSVNVCEFSYN